MNCSLTNQSSSWQDFMNLDFKGPSPLTLVELYTDGACSGNPGPGGWACILKSGDHLKKLSGFEPETTNNRMELMAVIMGLESLKRNVQVTITTDSVYVMKAFTDGWLANWRRRGWKTADGKPVKNQDLWERLDKALQGHQSSWKWVKGHNGHDMNEECDALARLAIKENLAKGVRSRV
jgi:ribonuclease HI